MGCYRLNFRDFDGILAELRKGYQVWAPVLRPGMGPYSDSDLVTYGEVETIGDIIFDRKTTYSPKEIVFPPAETLFYFTEDEYREPQLRDERGILIFARACDINAFRRLDAIFLANGPYVDWYYRRRRDRIKFVLMECDSGFDSCFCVSMGSNEVTGYSLMVRPQKGLVDCLVNDPDMEKFFSVYQVVDNIEPRFVRENLRKVNLPEGLDNRVFDLPLWDEYTERCAACGRCNVSCPTCSCFTMQDIFYRDNLRCGERRRVWASCMIDGFTEIAGGHEFRQKRGDRMRFRVMHKFSDFNRRFGFHMCVGCGRCDDVCPEYISLTGCLTRLEKALPGVGLNDR